LASLALSFPTFVPSSAVSATASVADNICDYAPWWPGCY
jgi:hypothetical protein